MMASPRQGTEEAARVKTSSADFPLTLADTDAVCEQSYVTW